MYDKEKDILEQSKKVLFLENLGQDTLKQEFSILLESYENLLSETAFITTMSDRLQKKLIKQKDDLKEKKNSLEKAQQVISQQNDALLTSKSNLEKEVKERTKELEIRTEELESAYEGLLMANSELDNFAYKAHHDLKGPIARIMGLCYVALRDVEDENALQYFNHMYFNAELMQEIMRRLLSINKLRANTVKVYRFELAEVIAKLEKSFDQIGYTESIVVKFKHQDILLYTDSSFFEVLLSNMLEYALKNSTKPDLSISRDKCEISFNFIEENYNLQIYITFTGEAIPEHLSEEIFELFHRTNRHPKHTGMELYTANLAVKKLDGFIELISSTEQETVFSIFLPQIVAPELKPE